MICRITPLIRVHLRPSAAPFLCVFCASAIPLFFVSSIHAQDTTAEVDFVEITPESRAAINKGLAYLAAIQQDDGSYGQERYGRHAGITGIVGMAFMADGHLPDRGVYGEHVRRCADFILAAANESGLIAADTSHGPMYGHGYAMLFLGELYGQTYDPRLRDVLQKGVRLIVNTQNHEGGWRYHPRPYDADISVTITQIMALRSARNAGLAVPRDTIDRAITYVRQCQNPQDGGFRYMLTAGGSAYPRSAAGVASLQYAGVYEDDAVTRGLEYLMRELTSPNAHAGGHYEYGHYYAAQATFLAGGDYWATWFPTVREELVASQLPNGSWSSNHGESYGTAMSLIVLEMPNRLLPIFQR
jgi:hypothetical protein